MRPNSGSPRLKGLVSTSGDTWEDVRRRLTPNYLVAWRDVAFCHVMLSAALGALATAGAAWGPRVAFLLAPIAACWLGFWLHALWLFGHEAAHNNLAATRSWNDLLADVFIWTFFGQSTSRFRASHWLHHRHHGGRGDSEITYHQCLSLGFLARSLGGFFLLKGLIGLPSQGTSRDGFGALWAPARSILVHVLLLGLLVVGGHRVVALAWLAGVVIFFPAFAAVRQVLEHRASEAGCDMDFAEVEHGPVNRMFSNDLLSRYFGAAGFNRHLLHHWAPDVAYSRFDELESFLRGTPLAGALAESRTTYVETLRRMLRAASSSPAQNAVRLPAQSSLRRIEVRS
jgi:fatty acid desaturase